MNHNNVIEFKKPGSESKDLLTDLLRDGAKKLIQEADCVTRGLGG